MLSRVSTVLRLGRHRAILAISLALGLGAAVPVFANVALTQVSSDPYTNTTSAHKTQVEPDTFSNGTTIVSAFQSGRFFNGGASNIGFATSTNSGATWSNGFLPGTTVFATPAGSYDRISDPSVAFDAKHNTWLIASLALVNSGSGVKGAAVLVNQSTNGGSTFGNPIVVSAAAGASDYDKSWVACDNTPASAFFGNCYVQWDDFGNGNLVLMSTSSDGGASWGSPKTTANRATGLGGQPVVQPDGTVIVPMSNAFETAILAFRSTDGGASWSRTVRIATVKDHNVAGGLRTGPLPTAEIDGAGKVFVAWQDCRFERACLANDIVMSTSTNGMAWSQPVRIPIDPINSGVDHFIPGLAVDKSTSGATALVGLTYYFYPVSNCGNSCQLDVGFVGSNDGGATWSNPVQLAGPMTLSWLPNTSQGRMVGDYISTSFAAGSSHPVFAVANANIGTTFDEAMDSPASGLTAAAVNPVTGSARALPDVASDHAPPPAALSRR